MLSQFERFAFLGEVRLYTYRNRFQNLVPTAKDVFSSLLKQHGAGKTFKTQDGHKTFIIADFQIGNSDYAEILFHMSDPQIPDNVLTDVNKGTFRVAKRSNGEVPVISAHFIVNLNSKYDRLKCYPSCIENIDYLPRSQMISFLNQWIASLLTKELVPPGKKEAQIFSPRIEFLAPASKTIEDLFDNSGVLTGVKWVEDEKRVHAFGDAEHTYVKRTNVGISVKGRPQKDVAKDLLKKILPVGSDTKPMKLKVTVLDENQKPKTVAIDPKKNNVLSNIFLPQVHLSNFSPPLQACEKSLHKDMVDKMKAELP